MSSFGVLSTGFSLKPLEIAKAELEDAARTNIDQDLNVLSTSVAGQWIGIIANAIAEQWEVQSAVYSASYPDTATGASLDGIAALTGVQRLAASQSTVTLTLNLDGGTIIPALSVVSVGATGPRFVTQALVTNAAATPANVTVAALSEDTGPVPANDGSIVTIATPVAGWTSNAGISALNTEPYDLSGGETLLVSADGAAAQTVSFIGGDFGAPGAATAAEVAARIGTDTTGLTASDSTGQVRIESDTSGATTAVEITGGTANVVLGFPTNKLAGMNPNTVATLVCVNSETYNLSGGETLNIAVNGAAAQLVTFAGGDFAVPTAATAAEVATRINTDTTGLLAFAAVGKVRLENETEGLGGTLRVTGGTANSVLGFATIVTQGANGDAVPGRALETDAELRARRLTLLSVAGNATTDAIRADVDLVTNVQSVSVFQNDTSVTDGAGRPPHSIEVVIFDNSGLADDVEVAQAIQDSKAAGIQAFGALGPFVATDSQGFSHSIAFTRATEVPIYIIATINFDQTPNAYAGDAAVQTELATFGNSLTLGFDVIIEKLKSEVFDVAGVVDITDFRIGTAPAPVGTSNIVITSTQIARFDTSNITVNATGVTPS